MGFGVHGFGFGIYRLPVLWMLKFTNLGVHGPGRRGVLAGGLLVACV